jgi:hypothetical protein
MKNLTLTLLIFLVSFYSISQEVVLPDEPEVGAIYSVFEIQGKGKMFMKIEEGSPREIKKIQNQLSYLGYNIEETGVLDNETKDALSAFNKKECRIISDCTCVITELTTSTLKKLVKKRKKEQKKFNKSN